ncbi:SRPBCC domain-containing protein [Tunicatimonas pelagia]|uniref:SRPBCC domain-containing protein n=1 Tax=Tunicatimonas pelagia TaxID=931531 RepID=UPI0026654C8C|nr:SRPBCC domain-containing protein [Tunicatimonas pelagia]WKN40766.1 SRPBCC domain-containing protein [Tunicatimonas pelagia]
MKELTTEIIINASAKRVWQVLTNFSAYQEWNPFIVSSSGKALKGSRLTNQMKQGDKTMTFSPKLISVEENRRLEWLGHLWIPGIFDGHHIFVIEEIAPQQVKLIQQEKFSGLLRGLIMKQAGETTQAGFIAMNRALKERAEQ